MKANTRESIIKKMDNKFKLRKTMTRRTFCKTNSFLESVILPFRKVDQKMPTIISSCSSSENGDDSSKISDFEDLGLTGSFRFAKLKANSDSLASNSTRDATEVSKINSILYVRPRKFYSKKTLL